MRNRTRVSTFAAMVTAAISSSADAQEQAAGELVFKQCNICHQVGENARNEVGPILNGIVGRKAGTTPDYEYSPGFRNVSLVWDEASLKEYIKDPKSMFPGTKMAFPGLKDERKIADLLAYLTKFTVDGKRAR
jgi:cytochrome c